MRFSGDSLRLLLDIRAGKLTFDEIMNLAEGLIADCEKLKATTSLPEACDPAIASGVLREITAAWEGRIA